MTNGVTLILNGSGFNIRNIIKACRTTELINETITSVHCTSSGSLCGIIFLMTSSWSERIKMLEDFGKIYNTNKYACENIRQFLDHLLPPNIIELMNDKLFIYYHNITCCGVYQINKSIFDNKADLIETVVRSASIPFITTSLPSQWLDGGIVPFVKCPIGSTIVVSKPEYVNMHMFVWNRENWQEVVDTCVSMPEKKHIQELCKIHIKKNVRILKSYKNNTYKRIGMFILILITLVFLANNIRRYGFVEGFLPWLPVLSMGAICRELYFPEYRRPLAFLGMFLLFYVVRCPKWLQAKIVASYITNFPINIQESKNAIYLLSPHGATTFAASRLCANLLMTTGRYPKLVCTPLLKYVPCMNMILNLVCDPIWADPKSVHNALKSSNIVVLYPGGMKEVFLNAIKNAPTSTIKMGHRLTKWLKESPLQKFNAQVIGESSVYYHPYWLVKLFQLLNRYVRVGLPIPTFLPFGKDPNTIQILLKPT